MEGALLGNVAGALILRPGVTSQATRQAAAASARTLSRVCSQVLLVGECADQIDSPEGVRGVAGEGDERALLQAALEATNAERMLVVPASDHESSVDLIAGLAAWPEQPAVVVHACDDDSSLGSAAIYCREAALAALETEPGMDLSALVTRLEGEYVSLETLGLADLLAEGC